MTIKWPKGKHMAKFRACAKANKEAILYGKVLVVDPASRRLGYATIEQGQITGQGIIEIAKGDVQQRLQDLVLTMQGEGEYDVLAVELIRGSRAHVYLQWSVGALVGSTNAHGLIEVPIQAWKAVAGPNHEKDDDEDARAMAETLLALAREV